MCNLLPLRDCELEERKNAEVGGGAWQPLPNQRLDSGACCISPRLKLALLTHIKIGFFSYYKNRFTVDTRERTQDNLEAGRMMLQI